MAARTQCSIVILLSCLLFITGCKEITVTTHVYKDGSCERMVEVKGDSAGLMMSFFPIPKDSTWSVTWERQEGEDKQYVYKASKRFPAVWDMVPYFDAPQDTSLRLHSRPSLKTGFRWFFTLYRYEEVYEAYNQFRYIPLSGFFTPEEMEIVFMNDDSSLVKEKLEEWERRNIMEMFLDRLTQAARKWNDPLLSPEAIQSRKDVLWNRLFSDDKDGGDSVIVVLRVCEEVFGTKSVWQLRSDIAGIIGEIAEKIAFMGDVESDSYVNCVTMPGLILDTNARDMEGNRVKWEIEPKRFLDQDYIMWVESRKVNTWAVAVSAGVLLLAAAAVLFAMIRRK
jgi:hypothetical protein